MKEKIIELKKVTRFSLIFTPSVFICCMLPYVVLTSENIKENFTIITLLLLIIAILAGTVTHELIHGICYALFNKKGFKTIKFGAYREHMVLYCQCSEPIKAKHYLITLLMPSIILGFIPLIVAFVIQSFALLFFACMMISGGVGDFIVAWYLHGIGKNDLIYDHPDKVGFCYKENL